MRGIKTQKTRKRNKQCLYFIFAISGKLNVWNLKLYKTLPATSEGQLLKDDFVMYLYIFGIAVLLLVGVMIEPEYSLTIQMTPDLRFILRIVEWLLAILLTAELIGLMFSHLHYAKYNQENAYPTAWMVFIPCGLYISFLTFLP